MATFKTPGVYVEEIRKFPPSVASVETAIPAFIGYTEKAEEINGDSLSLVPKRITSMLEYETYFGGAALEDSITVTVNDTIVNGSTQRAVKVNQPSDPKPYKMYYSLQMYFANGGGPCYITSVGDYSGPIPLLGDLEDGLTKIRKVDEPTLLLFPDATELGNVVDFGAIYQKALAQCNSLQDRFAIIDSYTSEEINDPNEPIVKLREAVGSEYLKYGAAYYPFLETILDYAYDENSVLIEHFAEVPNAVPAALASLNTKSTDLNTAINDLRSYIGSTPYSSAVAVTGSIPEIIEFLIDTFDVTNGSPTSAPYTPANTTAFIPLLEAGIDDLNELIELKELVKSDIDSVISSIEENAPAIAAIIALYEGPTGFKAYFEGTDKAEEVRDILTTLLTKLKSDSNADKRLLTVHTDTVNIKDEIAKLLVHTYTPTPYASALTFDIPSGGDLLEGASTKLASIIVEVNSADVANYDTDNGSLNGRYVSLIETFDNEAYNTIKVQIAALPITLPPSSTMAGVYARIDSNQGVWKAPANTSLSYVIKPAVQVSQEEQADLNVTSTGKSVNAIRTFTGKGTMVWGARTLAGNDNEWRYISVRRFFNFVEESVSEASEAFVFEPNDGNTWVRVRAMIENFLTLQWKAGALAGATPDQAFYVRVGLGSTMTSQDILEGKMIIEIGMAAVRPAEFIVLRFSHKMQEA
ncbi:MAG: phage tail sheath C-terminal domain-containing protein [Crocinitomicaceae bacterium]|nr:phage tail sheath C-terminal domain-containing protein [Crocinitomicaceae bacterium]